MRSANLLESKDVATRRQVSNPADPHATPWKWVEKRQPRVRSRTDV